MAVSSLTELQRKCVRAGGWGLAGGRPAAETRRSGYATFFSRTRNALWMKGETSGNRLKVLEILVDCDEDTLLLKVQRLGDGNVCHTGQRSCFYRTLAERETPAAEAVAVERGPRG